MSAYLMDIDGTIMYQGTNEFLPGAVGMLKGILRQGHQIIFVTRRGSAFGLYSAFKRAGLPRDLFVMTNVESPRILVNDQGAEAVNHPTDAPWTLGGS